MKNSKYKNSYQFKKCVISKKNSARLYFFSEKNNNVMGEIVSEIGTISMSVQY